jgi:hypothetical protein
MRTATVQIYLVCFRMIESKVTLHCLFLYAEIHNVAIADNHGQVHNLSRYQARWNKPRPESATIVKSWPWLYFKLVCWWQ